jgi:hypothetical protein
VHRLTDQPAKTLYRRERLRQLGECEVAPAGFIGNFADTGSFRVWAVCANIA